MAAPVFDAAATDTGNVDPFTWTHTIGGTNRVCLVAVKMHDLTHTLDSVSVGGVGGTFLRREGTATARIEVWIVVNPPTGAQTVSCNISGTSPPSNSLGISVSYSGVDQATTVRGTAGAHHASAPTQSQAIATQADDMVVDFGATSVERNFTPGANQTERAEVDVTGNSSMYTSEEVATGVSTTMSVTLSSASSLRHVVVALIPIASGALTVNATALSAALTLPAPAVFSEGSQIARPGADVVTAGWDPTPETDPAVFWSTVDEAIASDTDYALSPAAPGDALPLEMRFSQLVAPASTVAGGTLRVRLRDAPEIGAVEILPGTNIQGVVNLHPAGTTYLLKTGVHLQQTIIPKTGDTFLGEIGTILDGQGLTTYAFRRAGTMPAGSDAGPDNVTVRGASADHKLWIRNYAPPFQYGCIIAGGDGAGDGTDGWLLEDLEISHTVSGGGIRLGHTMTVRRCFVHHNDAIGIVGINNNGLIEDCEISYNNSIAMSPPGNEHGGTKFVASDGLVLRGNFVHHNHGPGLWTDIDNINVIVEDNTCDDNFGEGIVHEISYAAIIRNNTCRRNGLTDSRGDSWLWSAGIGVHASPNVEVYGNLLEGNRHGIALLQQARGSGAHGAYLVSNCSVHDNIVTFSNANQRHGAVDDTVSPTIWTSGNTFENNTYNHSGTGNVHYDWSGGPPESATAWVAYGHDDTGVFNA